MILAQELTSIKNNTCIELNYLNLSTQEVIQLAQALAHNTSVKKLELNECTIDKNAANTLAEALNQNKNLKFLYFNNVRFDTEALAILARSLGNNSSITELSIISCSITDADITTIALMLNQNNRLKKLNLSQNSGITATGLLCLIEAAQRKSATLTQLDLSNIVIDTDVKSKLALAQAYNPSLKVITTESRTNISSKKPQPFKGSFIKPASPAAPNTKPSAASANTTGRSIHTTSTQINGSSPHDEPLANQSALSNGTGSSMQNLTNQKAPLLASSDSSRESLQREPAYSNTAGTQATNAAWSGAVRRTAPLRFYNAYTTLGDQEVDVQESTADFTNSVLEKIISPFTAFEQANVKVTKAEFDAISHLKTLLTEIKIDEARSYLESTLKGNSTLFKGGFFSSSRALKKMFIDVKKCLDSCHSLELIRKRCEDYIEIKKGSKNPLSVLKCKAVIELNDKINRSLDEAHAFVKNSLSNPHDLIFKGYFSTRVRDLFQDTNNMLELHAAKAKRNLPTVC